MDGYYYANLNDGQKTIFPTSLAERFSLDNIFRTIQIYTLGIVFLILLMDLYQVHRLPRNKILFGLINTILLGSSILLITHHFGIVPLAFEQQVIDINKIRQPGDKNLYSINISTDKISDTSFRDFPVSLYENDMLLGPQHETQSLIDIYGRGGYILKGNFLFFSTSDNSDPRINEREYILRWPLRLRLRYQIIAYIALL